MNTSPDRWQIIKNKFIEATECEADARERWLAQLKSEDPELWAEVSSLLTVHGQADAVLDRVAVDYLPSETLEPGGDRWSGRRIGSYVVVDVLGRGGMGEVYRARRADAQYEKEVAVKVVRAGYDTGYILERFRAERQILANLDHPNIARLLDGGTTDEGLPYLVMELVEGERIDSYCDRMQLPVRDRLLLLRQVCDAVQYAHQRLVIHRDLKTSNMLVGRDGVPKLLDFGVAKLLKTAESATEVTVLRPMTPAYASPEQIRGEPLTTASDVYSLGVVLYELLTGSLPYPANSQALEQISHTIATTGPQRPSSALHAQQHGRGRVQSLEEICSARATTANRLRRQLLGDLDAIVLMALRTEPARRYGSVQQLAEDLDRHLRGAAVGAHRGSWRYRIHKFVTRNKTAVAATIAVFAALTAGLLMSTHQARIARAERLRAETRFEDVRKLANSLIFDVNDAMADTPGNTGARKLLLDRAVEYLDKLAQDAAGNANLQRELAWGFQKLAAVQGNTTESNVGQITAADKSLRKAVDLFEAVYRANPDSVADGLNLAMSHRLIGASDVYYPAGRPEIERAVEIANRLSSGHPGDVKIESERSRDYEFLGYAQDLAGERILAAGSVRRALALAQGIKQGNPKAPGIDESIARFTVHLGDVLARTGALKEAEARMQEGVERYSSLVHQVETADLARNIANARLRLGRLFLMRGKFDESSRQFDEAGAAVERLLKVDSENSMLAWDAASLSFDQGRVMVLSGHLQEAPGKFQPAFARYALHLEDDSGPGLGVLHAWMAHIYYQTGQYPRALRALHESIAALESEPLYADARSGLSADNVMIGNALLKLGQFSGARAAYQKASADVNLDGAVASGNIPALYAVADAQSGMGDLTSTQALALPQPHRQEQLAAACAFYAQSEQIWARILEPGLFNPSQFPSGDPRRVHTRLAACRAEQPPPHRASGPAAN